MLRLYDNKESRNGYKVLLLLTQLGTPFERIEIDLFKGESRTPAYLAKNPAGKIPALELEDGTVLAESGAACAARSRCCATSAWRTRGRSTTICRCEAATPDPSRRGLRPLLRMR